MGSGAPAARSSLATRRVRGVVLGCWKLAVSMTRPAMRSAAMAPSRASKPQAQVRQEQGHLLARRGGRGIHPVEGPEAWVGQVVVDVHDGDPGEQLGVVGQDPPHALQVAAVADDDEVRVEVGLRRGAEPLDVGHEVVHRGDHVSADRVHPRAQLASRARATESAEPSASASGSRWQTVMTAARCEQPGGQLPGHRVQVRRAQRAESLSAHGAPWPCARRRGPRGGGSPSAAPPRQRPIPGR